MRQTGSIFSLIVLTGGLLTGCGHSAPTRFFTLDPLPPVSPSASLASAAYAGQPVRLDAVHVPPTLDRVEVVRQMAPNQLEVRDLDHWGAPLGELARRALTQDLVQRLPQGEVIFPDAPRPPMVRDLVVDILDISTQGGTATMSASFTVLQDHTGRPALRGQVTLSVPQASEDAPDQARAFSQLLAQLSDRIAANLAGQS